MIERVIECANCGSRFETAGRRAKWCVRCSIAAKATQQLRYAEQLLSEAWPGQAVLVRGLIAEVSPRGMVSRADYLAGRSKR